MSICRRIAPLALFLGAWAIEAQAPANRTSVLIGVRAGHTAARQHGDYHVAGHTYDQVRGRTAGVVTTIELSPWFALQSEVGYSEKGAWWGRGYEMRLDYLEVPLIARISTPRRFGLRASLSVGLAKSWELQCSGYTTPPTIHSRSVPPPGTIAIRCADYRRERTDHASIAGAGLTYDRGRTQLTLDLRRLQGSNIGQRYALRNDVSTLTVALLRRVR